MGMDTVRSEWFREWYQWNELSHYLDNYCDVTTYLSETTGEWTTPEPYLFSINGNSYRWNKYYLNGFRVDSRVDAGGAYYRPDMFAHSMAIDYNRGAVYWTVDSVRPQQVVLSGQAGNIGGYGPLAKKLLDLQPGGSAVSRLADDRPIHHRRHTMWSLSFPSRESATPNMYMPTMAYAASCSGTTRVLPARMMPIIIMCSWMANCR